MRHLLELNSNPHPLDHVLASLQYHYNIEHHVLRIK
jgi:hypothetical protein